MVNKTLLKRKVIRLYRATKRRSNRALLSHGYRGCYSQKGWHESRKKILKCVACDLKLQVAKEMLICNPLAGLILSTGAGSEIQFTTAGLHPDNGECTYHRLDDLYDVEVNT